MKHRTQEAYRGREAPAPAQQTRPEEALMRRTRRLVEALSLFEPIALGQLAAVALQDRVDVKYIFHASALSELLPALAGNYAVLDVDGLRLSPYQTLYFDTADFALYRRHHDGWRTRYKVRSRRYLANDRSFLELKLKTAGGRTVKRRVESPSFITRLTPDGAALALGLPEAGVALEPTLRNDFTRITLASLERQERVTLDLNLRFANDHATIVLPGVVVAEVKQQRHDRDSPIIRQLRASHTRPARFSKYCSGAALLYPMLKHNAFKDQLRLVQNVMRGNEQ